MSTVYNTGCVQLNQPVTEEAVAAIKNHLSKWDAEDMARVFQQSLGGTEIEFVDYSDKEFDGTLTQVVKALEPLGYILNGSVEFFGDYGDGVTYITDNKVSEFAESDRWRVDATDEDLKEVLESRGYVVAKKDDKVA